MFSKQRSTFQFLSLFFFYFIYFRKHLNIVSSSLIIFFPFKHRYLSKESQRKWKISQNNHFIQPANNRDMI